MGACKIKKKEKEKGKKKKKTWLRQMVGTISSGPLNK